VWRDQPADTHITGPLDLDADLAGDITGGHALRI
jgi:hypothetical protein